MERDPTFTLSVTTDQPHCRLVFEPMGTSYDLSTGDEVLVHLYGRDVRQKADVDVMHEPGMISLFLWSQYRAWNKAGTELDV